MADTKHSLYHILVSSGIGFTPTEQKLLDNCEAKVTVDYFCSNYNIDLPHGFEEAEVPEELFSLVKGRINSLQDILADRKDKFYQGLDTDFLKYNRKKITSLFQELLYDLNNGESYIAEIMLKNHLGLEIAEPPSVYELEMQEAEQKYRRARKIIWGTAAAAITGLIISWASCEVNAAERPKLDLEAIVNK
ncbi:MAG TPA: hypothetical protein VJH68_05575 [Candidatus Nanoarchaeia archaeon]|nr:hypothetical protein [Candidatus Nanoarchaeia archaeon]